MNDRMTIVMACAIVLLIPNLVSFFLMLKDKRASETGKWRIKESTLFIATGCFGGLGGVLGMQLLRHKTKHWSFKVFFPMMLTAQMLVIIILAFRFL